MASQQNALKLDAKLALKLYEDMLLIRPPAGNVRPNFMVWGGSLPDSATFIYIGQEAAVVVGLQSVLESQDTVITAYRDHGHMLACGMDPGRVMAELTGRIDGYSKGKGGSMHMFSREKNFYGSLYCSVLWVRKCLWEQAWLLPINIIRIRVSHLPTWVMVQPTKAKCMRLIIWPLEATRCLYC